jgi:nucleoside-diphosphate-sugar epimerase
LKVLVTGNLGYVGTVLTESLVQNGHKVIGFDTGFFEECVLSQTSSNHNRLVQIKKDIREIEKFDLDGVDAVIHLAGLSNDPLGEFDSALTEEINLGGTIRIAEICKGVGIRRFVFASSQSMYGISGNETELDEENSEKKPLTSYAKTKWEAELSLQQISSNDFEVVTFRPSTVFGLSNRLRCDIVFNNFVSCAYTTGLIEIHSDGTPIRPSIHVRDLCSAFIIGATAPGKTVAGKAFNVGFPKSNYSVRDLATKAQEGVPGSKLVFTGKNNSDERTYRVSFAKIMRELKGLYFPEWDLARGAAELTKAFDEINFSEKVFRGVQCNRLKQIKSLIEANRLSRELKWL